MKILIVPDIHGEKFWKDYVNKPEDYDKIIFLGDYVDSFFVKDEEILDNLNDIIKFKRNNMDKVILLWGNHDLSYYDLKFMCSGFRWSMFAALNNIFKENENLFQLTYQIDYDDRKFLFSHAGISSAWLNKHIKTLDLNKDDTNLSEKINNLLLTNIGRQTLLDTIYSGGKYGESSPIWLRPEEYKNDNALYGYHQFVGHTPDSSNPNTYSFYKDEKIAKITILDRSKNKQAFSFLLPLLNELDTIKDVSYEEIIEESNEKSN